MIIPYGEYLLVKVLEKPKKHSFIMVEEEQEPIVRCELLDEGYKVASTLVPNKNILYFRRYELRDCVDKEKKIYLVKEECLLGYEAKDGREDAQASGEATKESGEVG